MNVGYIIQPNSKGQIVIPKDVRDEFGIDKNVFLNLIIRGRGMYLTPVRQVVSDMDTSSDAFVKVLEKTQGTWAGENWDKYDKLEQKRRKIEIKETEARRKAW